MFVNEPDLAVPSAVPLWEGANWLEREVWDMFGIRFEGHPDLRRILLPEEFTAFPLRKDYPLQGRGERHNFPVDRSERRADMPLDIAAIARRADRALARQRADRTQQDYVWTLNFGPQHPATHTTLRLVLKLDGERVVDAMPDIGYLHSGFEKIGEHLDYNQYVTVTDRMNYISPLANNVAWHDAVEKLLGIELTPRCKYIRTIICELARISDHLLCNGAVGLDTGAFTYFLYAFYQREVLYDIFETLCGHRFTNSYTRVGGVMYDITPLVVEKIRTFVRTFPKTLDDMDRLLNRNRIFVDRTKGVGVLTKDEAINRSCTGPIARASGVTRDLRKDEPYLAYQDFDFQVCCARRATATPAIWCAWPRCGESLKIVAQAIENLPAGPVNVDIGERTALPTKQQVYQRSRD